MLDFLVENYVWVIVIIIVILMVIIGYVAERTDFGHRKVEAVVNKKKQKQEKDKKDREKLKNSKLTLNDVVYKQKDENKEVAPVTEVTEPTPTADEISQDLWAPLGDAQQPQENNSTNFVDDLTQSFPDTQEDLTAPLPEMKTETVEEVTPETDSNMPLEEVVPEVIPEVTSEDNSEVVKEENETVENAETVDVPAMDANPTPEIKEVVPTEEEDNIWKF